MNNDSDLARTAALLWGEDPLRFFVTSYRTYGEHLTEVETAEAPDSDAAILLGQSAFIQHPAVIVFREAVDVMGIIRSAVIQTFGPVYNKP